MPGRATISAQIVMWQLSDDYTVQLFVTGDLSDEELTAIVESVEFVDATEWAAFAAAATATATATATHKHPPQ